MDPVLTRVRVPYTTYIDCLHKAIAFLHQSYIQDHTINYQMYRVAPSATKTKVAVTKHFFDI